MKPEEAALGVAAIAVVFAVIGWMVDSAVFNVAALIIGAGAIYIVVDDWRRLR